MRKLISAMVLAAGLFIPLEGGAQNPPLETVHDFIAACKRDTLPFLICQGTIRGVTQLQQYIGSLGGFKNLGVCYPNGTTLNQKVDVFVTWAKAHPKYWGYPVLVGIIRSSREKWPC